MTATTALTDLVCGKIGDPACLSTVPGSLQEALHEARIHHGAAENSAVPRLGAALTARLRERAPVREIRPPPCSHSGLNELSPAAAASMRASVVSKRSSCSSAHPHLPTASEIADVLAASGPDGEHSRKAMRNSAGGGACAMLLAEKLPPSSGCEHHEGAAILPAHIMRILDHHRKLGAERQEAVMAEVVESSEHLLGVTKSKPLQEVLEELSQKTGSPTGRRARQKQQSMAATASQQTRRESPRSPSPARKSCSPARQEAPRSPSPGGRQKRGAGKPGTPPKSALKPSKPHASIRKLHVEPKADIDCVGELRSSLPDCSSPSGSAEGARVQFADGSPELSSSTLARRPTASPANCSFAPLPMLEENPTEKSGLAVLKQDLEAKQADFLQKASGKDGVLFQHDDIWKTVRRLAQRKHFEELEAPQRELVVKKSTEVGRNTQAPVMLKRAGVSLVVDERTLVDLRVRRSTGKLGVPKCGGFSKKVAFVAADDRDDGLENVPFSVISCTSQREQMRYAAVNLADGEPGTMWESEHGPVQTLVLDTEEDHEVCGFSFRVMGGKTDPKDVSFYQSFGTKLHLASADGPWILAKRVFVNAGAKNRDKVEHEFLFESGGQIGRYWKLEINDNYGAPNAVALMAPLTLLAQPREEEHAWMSSTLRENRKSLQVLRMAPAIEDARVTLLFTEAQILCAEDHEARLVARRHDIPLEYAEKMRDEYREYAASANCLSYDDFCKLIQAMVTRSAKGGCKSKDGMPESRVRSLWSDLAAGHEYVNFEEFLIWVYKLFYCDEIECKSQHSKREANTVAERFYAGLGRQRLRKTVQRQVDAAERAHRKELQEA